MVSLFTNCVVGDATIIIISLVTALYVYQKWLYSYWQRRDVDIIPAVFPFGSFQQSFMQKISMAELMQQFYYKSSKPFIGAYSGLRPLVFFRDPDLIRMVFTKDFQHFRDHGFYVDEENDPLSAHLLSLTGEKWSNLRAKLSPAFTSGKLKAMFSTIVHCGLPLQNYLDKCVQRNEVVEMREIAACFSTNVIASVAFGIDINCIDNPNEEFRKVGRKVFEPSFSNAMRQLISIVSPALMKFLRIHSVSRDVENFFLTVVKQNLKLREEKNVIRKDFFQLLVQLRNAGHVESDNQWEAVVNKDEKSKSFTTEQVAAQSFFFFLAGFETSSTTISYCLYEMAKNPEIQEKVHEEINTVLAKYNGVLTYDSISEMKYLELCIDETLRKYPPLPALNRECTKDYQIPGSNVIIKKGTPAMIPVFALHYDEKFYPEPEKFIPERFLEANRKTFTDMPYLPFGDGPRACLGLRMGKMQTKVGLVSMLHKFHFQVPDKLINSRLEFSKKQFFLTPVGGIPLKVSKR